jgi:hypothetical protein
LVPNATLKGANIGVAALGACRDSEALGQALLVVVSFQSVGGRLSRKTAC